MSENIKERFARVADKYFELTTDPKDNKLWLYRDKKELQRDGVKLDQVPKYSGFTVEHNFSSNHRKNINGWLNLSQAIKWTTTKGEFPTIEVLFKHIFGEQLELGYDRYSLLINAN